MKKLIAIAGLALLTALLLAYAGCSSDDENPSSATGPCGITLTRPLPGEIFLSGEEVKIEWKRSGTDPTVAIELLKDGELISAISRDEENDGWYFWDAEFFQVGTDSTMVIDTGVVPPDTSYVTAPRYMANGNDYTVRVRATGDSGCQDVSPEFSLTNVAGCNYDFISPPAFDPDEPLVLDADVGQSYEIEWFSSFTTGLVDLVLVHVSEVIGYIATDVPDSLQSYTWVIDSLHEGTGANYKIRIQDTKVESCKQDSPVFMITDSNICEIAVNAPVRDEELTVGDFYTIRWNYQQVDGGLDITLFYKNALIDVIATDVDPNLLQWEWEVWAPIPEDNTTQYQIKITDNANLYAPCSGTSSAFLITD